MIHRKLNFRSLSPPPNFDMKGLQHELRRLGQEQSVIHDKLRDQQAQVSVVESFTPIMRSYQCPPYSCWIPVIPVDSGGIPAEFTSQNFTPATKLRNSGIYTGMVPGVQSPEWHRNPVTGIEI